MIVHGLFPTPVGCFKLDTDFTTTELDFIKNLETRPNQFNTTSQDTYLFDCPELSKIYNFCNESLQEYFQSIYSPTHDVSPYVTQSWSNYTSNGQSHHLHNHRSSFISGVLYIQAIKDTDRIYFYKSGYEQIGVKTDNFNLYNSENWWLGVETGLLLLFPSSLTHSVSVVETADTRISISFNTFLKGYIGEESTLTGLRL